MPELAELEKLTPPEAALVYAALGFRVFPVYEPDIERGGCSCRRRSKCDSPGKHPRTRNGFKDATTDPKQIKLWWRKWPNANIGIRTGDGLTVLDMDTDKGGQESLDELEAELGAKTPGAKVRTGGGGLHYYMGVDDVPSRAGLRPGLDVRGDGGYVVAPPSVHACEAPYAWIDPLPDKVPEDLPEPSEALLAILRGPTAHEAAAAAGGGWDWLRESMRNDKLFRVGCSLRRLGAVDVVRGLKALNEVYGDPPLSDSEVEKAGRSASRYPIGNQADSGVINQLNREFAHVLVGGKSGIMRFDNDGEWTGDIIRFSDFQRYLANRCWIPVGKDDKLINQADFFLHHSDRREYTGIVFEPGGPPKVWEPGDEMQPFNLWQGFAYEPRAGGNWKTFEDHLQKNVCQGDAELYGWVLQWIADLFQNPGHKPGTALVLRGKMGVGKTKVGEVMGRLIGDQHYKLVSSPRFITGNFNAHLAAALLLQGDEAFYAGDPRHAGVLKDLITGDRIMLERKYIDPIQVQNYTRVLFTSNADWVVPAGIEERRFAVFDVGEGNQQDTVYFGRMDRELKEEGGYEALLHHLLKDVEVDEAQIRMVPRTAALEDQKILTMPPENAWWLEVLEHGALPTTAPGMMDGSARLTSDLYNAYAEEMRRVGVRWPKSKVALGIFLKRVAPGLKKTRDGTPAPASRVRERQYEFPPLAECRRAFDPERDWGDGWETEDWGAYEIDM